MARSTFTPDGDPRTPFAAEDVPGDAKGRKMLGVVLYDGSGNVVTSFGGSGGGSGGVAFNEGAAVTGGTPVMWKDGGGNGLIASAANPLPVGVEGTLDFPDPLPTTGFTQAVAVEFSRPADTTAYAAHDAVNSSTSAPAALTLAGAARVAGGTGYVVKVRLNKSTNVATNAQFRVYFFNAAPAPVNDNAPYPLLWAERQNRLGYVDLTLATEGTGSDCAEALDATPRISFSCGVSSTSLYALIVANAAYVPASGESFRLTVGLEQN